MVARNPATQATGGGDETSNCIRMLGQRRDIINGTCIDVVTAGATRAT